MQHKINYQLEVLDPNTNQVLSLKACVLTSWDQVTAQIEHDKRVFVDRARCSIRYNASDTQAELTGAFGV